MARLTDRFPESILSLLRPSHIENVSVTRNSLRGGYDIDLRAFVSDRDTRAAGAAFEGIIIDAECHAADQPALPEGERRLSDGAVE